MERTRLKRMLAILLFFILIPLTFAAVNADELIDERYLIPWHYDSIAETAVEDNAIHFFFMAGEGLEVNPGSSTSDGDVWGDSCLIAFPNGELMLVDTGMPLYAPVLFENLRRLGVEKLDYLVITHPHNDHVGGVVFAKDGLLDEFEVGMVYYTGVMNAGWSDAHLLEKVCDAHDVPYQLIYEGETFEIGEACFQVLNPAPELVGTVQPSVNTVNNASLVFRMDFREFSALFTGDIYQEQEFVLVKKYPDLLDVDLLKIPHHGRTTSNSGSFADAVSPSLAVAMSRIVLDGLTYYKYTKLGSKVLFDYVDGYIHVTTDGNGINWETSRARETTYYDKYEFENLKKK